MSTGFMKCYNWLWLLLVLLLSAFCAIGGDYTPVTEEAGVDFADIEEMTLDTGMEIDSSDSNAVEIISSADGSTLLTLTLDSANAADNMADNDKVVLRLRAYDDATNQTAYATIELSAADVTDTTEDGKITLKVYVNGTNTDVAVVDATGITPSTDDTFDLGSSSYEWQDGYFDGTVNADLVAADDVHATDASIVSRKALLSKDDTTQCATEYGTCTNGETVAFTTPFASGTPAVFITYTASSASNIACQATSIDTNGFTCAAEQAIGCSWFAIGVK